jgi:hypothetical protein
MSSGREQLISIMMSLREGKWVVEDNDGTYLYTTNKDYWWHQPNTASIYPSQQEAKDAAEQWLPIYVQDRLVIREMTAREIGEHIG